MGTEFRLDTIGQIAVSVSDIDRATEFYRETLGLRYLFSALPGMSFFDCDGVRLMLTVPERSSDESKGSSAVSRTVPGVHTEDDPHLGIAHGSVVYFTVSDVRQATETLASRGVQFVGEPHVVHRAESYDLWMAFFTDPDGNTLALMAEVPR